MDGNESIYYEIKQELNAMKSFGVDFKNITISNNFLYVGSPCILEEFLNEYNIINFPFLIMSNVININISENFRLQNVDKDALYQSALTHYKNDPPKNLDYTVEFAYQNALKDRRRKEKQLTDDFLLKINGKYKHLLNAINNFNAQKRRQKCHK